MRSIRVLLVVATMMFAFSALGSPVSAHSPKSFELTKVCTPEPVCTVVTSDFKAIPAGTVITYAYLAPGLFAPTIVVRNGSTTGVCNWNQPPGPVLAKCTFDSGTGRLTQFHLTVDVTTPDMTLWYWNGTYRFGKGR